MKNKILISIIIFFILSLTLNIKQYNIINSLKADQHNINKELKANIQDLILSIDSLTYENYKDKIPLYTRISGKIYVLVLFSTYTDNEKVRACFRKIDNLFTNYSEELVLYKEELINLLNNIIKNTDQFELNEKACQNLNDFIDNIIYKWNSSSIK